MNPTSDRPKITLDEFRQSLTATEPPAGLTLTLAGLWRDAKGDWTRAHEAAQQDEGRDGSWGFMRTFIERKAIRAMQTTGTVGPGNLFAGSRWIRSG